MLLAYLLHVYLMKKLRALIIDSIVYKIFQNWSQCTTGTDFDELKSRSVSVDAIMITRCSEVNIRSARKPGSEKSLDGTVAVFHEMRCELLH